MGEVARAGCAATPVSLAEANPRSGLDGWGRCQNAVGGNLSGGRVDVVEVDLGLRIERGQPFHGTYQPLAVWRRQDQHRQLQLRQAFLADQAIAQPPGLGPRGVRQADGDDLAGDHRPAERVRLKRPVRAPDQAAQPRRCLQRGAAQGLDPVGQALDRPLQQTAARQARQAAGQNLGRDRAGQGRHDQRDSHPPAQSCPDLRHRSQKLRRQGWNARGRSFHPT